MQRRPIGKQPRWLQHWKQHWKSTLLFWLGPAAFLVALQFRLQLSSNNAAGERPISNSPNLSADENKAGGPSASVAQRRVIYQCTCTDNFYWRDDLGRSKQWRRALRRIDDLVPEIETMEIILDMNDTDTCEELILRDMIRSPPFAYEIIYSPWYQHKRGELDLSQLNMSESASGGRSGAHATHPRGMRRNIKDWGETFHGRGVRCNSDDKSTLHFSHSRHLMPYQQKCRIVHGPEVIDWATMIADYRGRNESVPDLLTKRLSKDEARAALERKEAFAGLVVMSSWKPYYDTGPMNHNHIIEIDSLVRHALCELLTAIYKRCERLVAWKGDVDRFQKKNNITVQFRHDTMPLYRNFKFAIAMNNALWAGYSTEKEINPYLADTIAIAGTPDYSMMANANRVLHCTIPKETLDYAGQWAREGSFMPFNTTPDDWGKDPTIKPIPWKLEEDEGLIQFAKDKFADALKPCIAEIIRLDKDDESYMEKLMEPFIYRYENSLFDGTYVAAELLDWLQGMESQVTAGLESGLRNVRIDDQSRRKWQ